MNDGLSSRLNTLLARGEPAILVSVAEAYGSTPRERGALMLVAHGESAGTIGGGALEFHAIDVARAMLARGESAREVALPLGPLLGQCCGGRVVLAFRQASAAEADGLARAERAAAEERPLVLVFGAGHTGLALTRALALLPVRTTLVDDRLALPGELPLGLMVRRLDDPADAVGDAAPGSAFVILTHSHALDYRLAETALRRDDACYVGMIGSATKRARFERFFRQSNGPLSRLAGFTCPIGGPAIADKRPEIIAALVAGELVRAFASGSEERKTRRQAKVSRVRVP